MRAYSNRPKVKKHNDGGKGNELAYAVSTMQGWRANQEDRYIAQCVLKGLPNWSFFGVFDGHGGSVAARICERYFLRELMQQSFMKELAESKSEESVNLMEEAIKSAFLNFDVKMNERCNVSKGLDMCGSTSVCVLISPTHYYFINCGDSRALLSRGGSVHFATEDHKPENPEEKERIDNAGGSVIVERINGILAVSRALGDFAFKELKEKGPTEQLVSPEPDVTAVERNIQDDQFLILASDGIFNVITNDELSSFVLKRLKVNLILEKIVNDTVELSFTKGSRDNITMILVALPSCPKPRNKPPGEASTSTRALFMR